MLNQVSRLALAGAIVTLGTPAAWAIEADDFGTKLKDAVQMLGISFEYGSARAEGDTVTLSDFTIFVPGEESSEIPGDVVFSGVTETGDGGYAVETASIADIELDDLDDGFALAFQNIAVQGINIPASIDVSNLLPAAMGLYQRASAGPLVVSQNGEEVFAVDTIAITMDQADGVEEITSSLLIDGIRADLTTIPEAEAQEVVAAFGIEQLSARVAGSSTWYPEAGRATFEDFVFAIDNLGSLTGSGAILGYDRAFYQDLMKINLKMAELAKSGEEISESEMAGIESAMAEKMMQVQIESLSLRYDDASLFMKALDFIGAEQGVDGATFANGLKFMVPLALAELPDAAFKTEVTQAVNAFIDDPQNFEIVAEPDEPVGVEALAAAEEDPLALVDLLNVTVRANQ